MAAYLLKTKERESKQFAREDPVFKTKERESKQLARENEAYSAQEKVYQNASKNKARENPYVLECERIKKQQKRKEKRKFNDDSGINVPRKKNVSMTQTLCQKVIRKTYLSRSLSNDSIQT